MKTTSKIYNAIALFLFAASQQIMAQGVQLNNPGSNINNSQTSNTQQSILVYVMGWMKWIVIIGLVISICMTAFYFSTGNKDKGKAWGIGCITGILIWFLAPSILSAFGITLNW